jgi:UDP-glucose 4-epimerase
MHYIITGGLGFIGSRIGTRLLADGHRVTVIDNLTTAVGATLPGAEVHQVDLRDAADVAALHLPAADCLMHLAGPSSGMASAKDPVGTIADGYRLTFNALELAARLGVKRVIHASSMNVYGNVRPDQNPVREDGPCAPISHYAIGKFANERLVEVFCKERGMSFVNLRMFNVYGPGQNLARTDQGLVSIFTAMLMKGPKAVSRGSLDRFRDLVHIDDVITTWLLCASRNEATGTFNVGSGKSLTIKELISTIADELGIGDKLEIEVAAGTPGDLFGICADVSALRAAIGYSPTISPSEGVRQFVRWAVTQS